MLYLLLVVQWVFSLVCFLNQPKQVNASSFKNRSTECCLKLWLTRVFYFLSLCMLPPGITQISSIAKRRPSWLGDTHCYFRKPLGKKNYLDLKQAWNIRAKANTKAEATAPYAPSNKVLSAKAQETVGALAVKIRQEHSRRTQQEYEGTWSEQSRQTACWNVSQALCLHHLSQS